MLYIQMLQKECKGMQSAVPESTRGTSTAQRASSWHKILRRCDSTTPNHQRLCTALQTTVVGNPKGQRQKHHYDIITEAFKFHLKPKKNHSGATDYALAAAKKTSTAVS
jgi:hypothetical protein